jgi:hypothetical protein
MKHFLAALAAFLALATGGAHADDRYLIFVTIDGLRWQEVVRGAYPGLVQDPAWRARYVDVSDRPAALTPFLSGLSARGGVFVGDRDRGSCAKVTNRYWVSYPGYAEMLAGRVNPRINSNEATPNDQVSFLEWAAKQPGYRNGVMAFHEWHKMAAILNTKRSGLPLMHPAPKDTVRDPKVIAAARKAYDAEPPRILYVGLGDTDNSAHKGDYLGYLAAATQADAFIAELWTKAEADPRTAGKTTLLVTTDHGRGTSVGGRWKMHSSGWYRGVWIPGLRRDGSDAVWMAAIGPDVDPNGGKRYGPARCAETRQVAATALTALGFDPTAFSAEAAAPLDIFR